MSDKKSPHYHLVKELSDVVGVKEFSEFGTKYVKLLQFESRVHKSFLELVKLLGNPKACRLFFQIRQAELKKHMEVLAEGERLMSMGEELFDKVKK